MNEVIEHELKCEEIAIIHFQDESYRDSDFRESRLQNAKSTYSALLQRHFPGEASVQEAYLDATQRIEEIENTEKKLEGEIRVERFKLKAIPQECGEVSSTTFHRPIKKSHASQQFTNSQKKKAPLTAPPEVSSDLLTDLKKTFEQRIAEKRRLQLRLQILSSRLNPLPTKAATHTITGVGLWKKSDESSRNASPSPTHDELDSGFKITLG